MNIIGLIFVTWVVVEITVELVKNRDNRKKNK